MVTDKQVSRLRKLLMDGKTLQAAALTTAMSERSARKWQKGPLPSQTKGPRTWRTRPDAFARVWESEIEPLLLADKDGVLEGQTVLDVLEEKHPGQFDKSQLRTVQRRLREWRALHGPGKDVKFAQDHIPGREASFDFTHCEELSVTILGQFFKHLLFELVLSFSGWTWVMLAFGETFEALTAGIQGAFWELGGVTQVVRSDNLSAATHELAKGAGRSLTQRYSDFLKHYGLQSTRIRPGQAHENGVAEKAHDLLKGQLQQALMVRGSRDFESVQAYMEFVQGVVARKRNQGIEAELALEKSKLKELPSSRMPNYSTYRTKVRCWSTITVRGCVYSVPSSLIGHEVEVRVYPDTVEVYFRDKLIQSMSRLRGEGQHRIDYRHIIWSLVRKPGAFARYRFREDLFPSLVFRRTYDALRSYHSDRADVEYVRILHLSASTMQSQVESALSQLLEASERFDYLAVKALASPEPTEVPTIHIGRPDLKAYDALLSAAGES